MVKPGDRMILWGQYLATVLSVKGKRAYVLYFHGSESRPQKIWVDAVALSHGEVKGLVRLFEIEEEVMTTITADDNDHVQAQKEDARREWDDARREQRDRWYYKK